MNEFDKWFSKDGSIIPVPEDAGYEGYVERRTSWKAALEWAKSRSTNMIGCKRTISTSEIERELEE